MQIHQNWRIDVRLKSIQTISSRYARVFCLIYFSDFAVTKNVTPASDKWNGFSLFDIFYFTLHNFVNTTDIDWLTLWYISIFLFSTFSKKKNSIHLWHVKFFISYNIYMYVYIFFIKKNNFLLEFDFTIVSQMLCWSETIKAD